VSAPPRARTEYSRGSEASEGVSGAGQRRFSRGARGPLKPPWGRVGAWLFLGSTVAAALLIVAEFTTLYDEQISTSAVPLHSTGTGAHDSYAVIPISVLVLLLAFAVLRAGSRPALLAIGIAGLVALLIALLGDLPDANSTGNLQSPSGQIVQARTTPGVGMYLESAGAILLIATCGLGFLFLGPPVPSPRRVAEPAPAQADPGAGPGQSGS